MHKQNYIYPFQDLSRGFILKIFLKFRKFQPRYSYKIYSYKKKRVYMSTKIIARREKPPIVGTSSYLALQYHAGHVGSGAGGDLVQNCVLFACKPHPYPLKWNDSIA